MNYQSLAAKNLGRSVSIAGVQHTISKLADNEGKLKNGDSVPYIIMTSATGEEVPLHPRKALQLFTKGEVDGIALLVEAVAKPDKAKTEKQAQIDAFFSGGVKPEEVPPTAKADEAPAIVKPKSKKQMTIDIFNEAVVLKETRQYVIKRMMAELPCSLNCANTYYQGVKSGNYQ